MEQQLQAMTAGPLSASCLNSPIPGCTEEIKYWNISKSSTSKSPEKLLGRLPPVPLLTSCGSGETLQTEDSGRLISSNKRSEVTGNEQQWRRTQIARGFMERFLLSEHIPNKSSVNKAGKFFSCASCYEDAGILLEWYLAKVRLSLSQHINKWTKALSQHAPHTHRLL